MIVIIAWSYYYCF